MRDSSATITRQPHHWPMDRCGAKTKTPQIHVFSCCQPMGCSCYGTHLLGPPTPPSDVPPPHSQNSMLDTDTLCTAGSSSARPDRAGGLYPLRVGVTMSMHKLTAGAGYDY